MRTIAVVPARLESTRLEKKLLRTVLNLPIIVLTTINLIKSNLFDDVCVITDSDEIIEVLKKHSINYLKSKKNHETGTDRISEFADHFDCDILINVQGDEPFINRIDLELIINTFKNDNDKNIDVISLKKELICEDEIKNPNNVKVICDSESNAIYFSRNQIPHNRSGSKVKYFKHIGVYAFRKNALKHFSSLKKLNLEKAEVIEAIRLIENGLKIKILEVFNDYFSIDTEEDLLKAKKLYGN